MTYCGAIGSVNVLEFMSTELFDESQENPFLLKSPVHEATIMSASSSPQHRRSLVSAKCAFELPLHDQQQDVSGHHSNASSPSPTKLYQQQQQQQYHHQPQQPSHYQSAPTSPLSALTNSPSGRASVTFNLPKSILKRQSSYDSDSSTVPPSETDFVGVDVNETELHKLLYSLARFSVASEASVVSDLSPSPQQPQHQHSISQPVSPNATLNSSSLWFDGSNAPPPSPMSSPRKSGHAQGWAQPRNPSSSVKQSKARSKSADRGYETDPEAFTTSDEYEFETDDRGLGRTARSRGSVSFETVKNLLRGGGSGARASRIVKRTLPDLRRKSMGTVSSRLKRRQKFERPTILTDAYHRVYVFSYLLPWISSHHYYLLNASCPPIYYYRSTMKLGTKPMPVKVRHLAFPEPSEVEGVEVEHDPDMPSPRGQLRHNSLVLLETLDKIGTRAACPVHLIDLEMPDYSNIPARVDSYNHMLKPKQGLRRPSDWLLGNAAAMVSFQAPPQCYESD